MNLANTPVRLDSNGYLVVSIGAGSTTLFGDGTSAAPSMAYQSQPGLGWYRSSANHMTLANDGAIGGIPMDIAQGIKLAGTAGAVYAWSTSGSALGSADTGISRVTSGVMAFGNGSASNTAATLQATTLSLAGKSSVYNGVATTGHGLPSIYGANRVVQTTAAVSFLTGYTSGAADESLEISANILITTHGSEAITIAVSYTDESGSARVFTLPLTSLAGAVAPTAGAAGPFSNAGQHIRVKQTTAVSMATTGTFTSATYNVDGSIKKIA